MGGEAPKTGGRLDQIFSQKQKESNNLIESARERGSPMILNDQPFILESVLKGRKQKPVDPKNLLKTPWKWIGYIFTTFPSGASISGSGFLIAKNIVLTTAHNVYNNEQQGMTKNCKFRLCLKNRDFLLQFIPQHIYVPPQYQRINETNRAHYDFALLIVKPEINNTTADLLQWLYEDSFLPLTAVKYEKQNLNNVAVFGYPTDRNREVNNMKFRITSQFGNQGEIKEILPPYIHYYISTSIGQCGAPLLRLRDNALEVIGIHKAGHISLEYNVSINLQNVKAIATHKKIDNYPINFSQIFDSIQKGNHVKVEEQSLEQVAVKILIDLIKDEVLTTTTLSKQVSTLSLQEKQSIKRLCIKSTSDEDMTINQVRDCFQNIEEISILSEELCRDQNLHKLILVLPENLQVLRIYHTKNQFNANHLELLKERNIQLKVLTFAMDISPSNNYFNEARNHLESVHWRKETTTINAKMMKDYADFNKSLSSLWVLNQPKIQDEVYQQILHSKTTWSQLLIGSKMMNQAISEPIWKGITNANKLISLAFYNVPNLNEKLTSQNAPGYFTGLRKVIQNNKDSLRSLMICFCKGENEQDLHGLKECENLETLILITKGDSTTNISGGFLVPLIRLKHLHIQNYPLIGNQLILSLKNMVRLEYIGVSNSMNSLINDTFIDEVIKLARVTGVAFKNCNHISESGLLKLLKNKQLKNISLKETMLSAAVLVELSNLCELQKLNVQYNESIISDASLKVLGERMVYLTHLGINNCQHITPQFFSNLKLFKSLKFLSCCPKIETKVKQYRPDLITI